MNKRWMGLGVTAGLAAAGVTLALLAAREPGTGPGPGPGPGPEPSGGPIEQAGPFYPGPEASATYDRLFRQGPEIPRLDTHTPQGLATWLDWDGTGADLLLVGAYRDQAPALLSALDPADGRLLGTVQLAPSHMSVVAVLDGWLFVQDRSRDAVLPYQLEALRSALRTAITYGTRPTLTPSGPPQPVIGANFASVHAGTVWLGRYTKGADAQMREYEARDGVLSPVGEPLPVPRRSQGLLVTDEAFVFVSGLAQGVVTVLDRRSAMPADFGAAPGRFRSPSYPQNLVAYRGLAYLLFEGGSAKFDAVEVPNRIRHLHVADEQELLALAGSSPAPQD